MPDPKSTKPDAASELFARFAHRLIALARAHLDARLRSRVDPEDVVQSAYKSFFLRYGEAAIASEGWDGLWGILTVITLRKCVERARYHRAARRNVAREAAMSRGEGNADPWQQAIGREPMPEHAAALAETVEQLLRDMDEDDRPIIELSLQGYAVSEISEQTGRAQRSVRRLRERARKRLQRMREA
jgi:RNA polymerase sigma-70 factor (ECF subfamily)